MADIVDVAQQSEAYIVRSALSARCLSGQEDVSLTHCETCGEAIPQARRDAVPCVRLCRECQEDIEKTGAWA